MKAIKWRKQVIDCYLAKITTGLYLMAYDGGTLVYVHEQARSGSSVHGFFKMSKRLKAFGVRYNELALHKTIRVLELKPIRELGKEIDALIKERRRFFNLIDTLDDIRYEISETISADKET